MPQQNIRLGPDYLEPFEVALLNQVDVGGNLAGRWLAARFPWMFKYAQTYADTLARKKLRIAQRTYDIMLLGASVEGFASRESTIVALWHHGYLGSVGKELEL